ncbi:YciI family protein [Kribbella sp. NPDC050281]|uniref:YciI family protein n=1 Tax=Kribbella sp. NPDC050281 TaxID=3155515 RepID=UPI0033BFE609
MSHYLLSVYEAENQVEGAPATPEDTQAFMRRVIALEEEMDAAGAFVFGGALHGPDAATVVRGGTGLDKVTTDGPFAEGKEHIGGFYIIDAENLDEALAWANKVVEAINHAIEVRPFRATGRLQDGEGH